MAANSRQNTVARALSNFAAWKIAVGVLVLGVFFMWLSHHLQDGHDATAVETTLTELGALLVVTGTLTVFWDLHGRRALTDEVLAAANLSTDVTASGLTRIASNYHDLAWDDMLDRSGHVDLFFAYAKTWRMTHATALHRLVVRDGSRLRVVLPDREHAPLMAMLAAKFDYELPYLSEAIADAESDFLNLARQASKKSDVEVRRTREFPVYTYYRFDGRCITFLYSQAKGRIDVPGFESEQGGGLNRFFREQFDRLWETSVRIGSETET